MQRARGNHSRAEPLSGDGARETDPMLVRRVAVRLAAALAELARQHPEGIRSAVETSLIDDGPTSPFSGALGTALETLRHELPPDVPFATALDYASGILWGPPHPTWRWWPVERPVRERLRTLVTLLGEMVAGERAAITGPVPAVGVPHFAPRAASVARPIAAPAAPDALGRLFNTDDVAVRLGLQRSGVLALIRRKRLPAVKHGRRWFVREAALLQPFVEAERRAEAASPEARIARLMALMPPRRGRRLGGGRAWRA